MKRISQFISFQLACNIDISDSRKKVINVKISFEKTYIKI